MHDAGDIVATFKDGCSIGEDETASLKWSRSACRRSKTGRRIVVGANGSPAIDNRLFQQRGRTIPWVSVCEFRADTSPRSKASVSDLDALSAVCFGATPTVRLTILRTRQASNCAGKDQPLGSQSQMDLVDSYTRRP